MFLMQVGILFSSYYSFQGFSTTCKLKSTSGPSDTSTTAKHAGLPADRRTDSHSGKRGITIKLATPTHRSTSAQRQMRQIRNLGRTPLHHGRSRPSDFVRRRAGTRDSMATVIAASSIMDGALFVIATNEKCPHPDGRTPQSWRPPRFPTSSSCRTVDLVTKESAPVAHEIRSSSALRASPIVPMAANTGINIDALLEVIKDHPDAHNPGETFRMHVVRSFDVNKPGADLDKLVGAVLGGTVRSEPSRRAIKSNPGHPQAENKETYERHKHRLEPRAAPQTRQSGPRRPHRPVHRT